jgi:hypothetical protein
VLLVAEVLGCSSRRAPEAPEAQGELDDPASCVDAAPAADVGVPTTVSGYLSADTIRDVVRSRHPELEGCYQLGVGRHSQLGGKVTFAFVIGVDGEVAELRVADNSMPDCGTVRCMRDALTRAEFPAPEGGTVSVEYPITFEPASAGPQPTSAP